jgi:hypothetical protein
MRRIGTMAGTGILSLALVMVLLGSLSGLATAQSPTPPPLTLDQLRWNEIQQKLGLTPDQATTLQALLSASRATMKIDVQALKAAHQSLRAAWDAADAGSIRTAFGQVQAAQSQLANDRLSTQLQILQTLGPDLYKQWRALHHHGRHGWGYGFGPGM